MINKVVLIGCGNVGMSYAYALLNQKTFVNELALIDLNEERIMGEVMDLNHCLAFAPSKMVIKLGSYEDCHDASIVVIAAGANQAVGETRMDLIHKNSVIFKKIINDVVKNGFHGVFVVATNPLDVMTYLTYKYSKFPASRVIGSGTCLDTARLRYIVGTKLDINPKNVHGYVIGEHGDSEIIPWSNVNVGLQNIKDFLTDEDMQNIGDKVRNAAYEIIKKKGATYYGIGMCLVEITNAILGDEQEILAVSTYDKVNDIYMGMPAVIGRNGILKKVYFSLNKEEEEKLQNSVDVIKKAIISLDNE
jgi:L-lactate dehydrogenase